MKEKQTSMFDDEEMGIQPTQKRGRPKKQETIENEKLSKEKASLYERYGVLPISTLHLQTVRSNNRKNWWFQQGIVNNIIVQADPNSNRQTPTVAYTNPFLSEIVIGWFAPENAIILDPFAGSMVTGAVAARLGKKFYGIELRKEQVDSNYISFEKFRKEGDVEPVWVCADSSEFLSSEEAKEIKPNFIFTTPPYWNLDKYSELEEDIANRDWDAFLAGYHSILSKSLVLLNEGDYVCIVLGDIRDQYTGFYKNFDAETIRICTLYGFQLANRLVVETPIGSAALRADKSMQYKKVVKTHQDLLIFQKPYSLETITRMRQTMTDEEIAKKLNMAIRQIHRYSRLEARKRYAESSFDFEIPPTDVQ